MNLGDGMAEALAALGAVALVAVLFLGTALEAWMDYRDDVDTQREWEERMRERCGDGEK